MEEPWKSWWSPRRAAIMVLVSFVGLWSQLLFALYIEEPYPNVVFPSFGSAPKDRQLPTTYKFAQLNVDAMDAQGEVFALTQEQLYEGPHAAARSALLNRTCPQPAKQESKRASRAKHGHKAHFKLKVYIEDELRGGYFRQDHPDLGAWLVQRASVVLGRPIVQVSLHWRRREVELTTQVSLVDEPLKSCVWDHRGLIKEVTP